MWLRFDPSHTVQIASIQYHVKIANKYLLNLLVDIVGIVYLNQNKDEERIV